MAESRTGLGGAGVGPIIFVQAEKAVVEIHGLFKGEVRAHYSNGQEEVQEIFSENGEYPIGRCNWVRFSHEGEEISETLICNVVSE